MHKQEVIYLGGGCFWCLEAVFQRVDGVLEVVPGYSGGDKPNPTYQEVSKGDSGYVEVVKLTLDTGLVSLSDILNIFWRIHDPTSLDRQGHDVGPQYRSVVYCQSQEQVQVVQESIRAVQSLGLYADKLVTQVLMWKNFYPAEAYHLNYYNTHPQAGYCRLVIEPKLTKLADWQKSG